MHDTFRRFLVIAVGASLLTGCVWFNAGSSFNRKDLSRKANTIRLGAKTRAEVHEMLGEPWIASEHWRVEVYRNTGKHWQVIIPDFLVPLPMPSNISGYTLVSYSATGAVDAVGTGLSEERKEHCYLNIQAGDYSFIDQCAGNPKYMGQALIASHDRFFRAFAASDAKPCTVLVYCPESCGKPADWDLGSEFALDLQIDDDTSSRPLINRFAAGSRFPLVPVVAGVGKHTLRVRGRGSNGPNDFNLGEISSQFTCPAQGLLYAVTIPALSKRSWWPFSRPTLSGAVQVQSEIPANLSDSGVMLWTTHGRWLVPSDR
jgi:hypothetical protein